MGLGKKIKAVRIAENLSQLEFSQLTDISIDSLRSYENDRRSVNEVNMTKITTHERFKKYTFWLMTGETIAKSGQISPAFSILLELGIVEDDANSQKRA